jgi:hypothetical protein
VKALTCDFRTIGLATMAKLAQVLPKLQKKCIINKTARVYNFTNEI